MNDLYNIFGEFVRNKNIENFAEIDEETETVDVSDRIQEITARMKSGEIKEEEIKKEITILQKLNDDGQLSKEDQLLFQKLIKNNVRLTDGINLVGNLELGGIIKARGFHLSDGTKINTITKTKDKLAVPLDKDGNIHIKPASGKKMKIDKSDIKHLNIPKDGRITFGEGEDGDPYNLRKVGNKDANHLRLTLNDNNNESLQIWGNSCKTGKCVPDSETVKHVFDSDGNALHYGNLQVKNPTGEPTHFNYKKEGKNYIRGQTELKGEVNFVDTTKGINISNAKNANNPSGQSTHFNHNGQSINYISGWTRLRGGVDFIDSTKSVTISNAKNANNPTGEPTRFNDGVTSQNHIIGSNYIRGKTEMRGETNFVDTTKGINIYNAKNANNTSGWGTHFNYQGKGLNYIRGKTEMRGEVNFVDNAKGINITNAKNANNTTGGATHFNYAGKGSNYIRGSTEIKGTHVDINTNTGLKVHGHGKVSTFGSLNSGWCHLTTNAASFYMNKGLQINGTISSYSNKPLNANKGVNAPSYSRIGGDWLRINPEGNSVGQVATYGGFSINDVRKGKGGLGVGYWGQPGQGNIKATGNISSGNGLTVTGGRTWIKDAENKGRLRVGAAWGIPGLYSEDNQDVVIGCASNRQVHLGRPNLVRIDKDGNLHLPAGKNIYIGGQKVAKNGDSLTLRSNRNGYRMQHSNWNAAARFSNGNRGPWEKMHLELF